MRIDAKVIEGYGVASGKSGDSRYPKGTIKAQLSYFQKHGLDLSDYYMGTLNVDISPFSFKIKTPKHSFYQINWSPHIPPENFFFFDVSMTYDGNTYDGLIYMPDPSTKPEHVQKPNTLELILPKIPDIGYGCKVSLLISDSQLEIITYK